jgi:hypothetical protein
MGTIRIQAISPIMAFFAWFIDIDFAILQNIGVGQYRMSKHMLRKSAQKCGITMFRKSQSQG